MEPRHIAIEGPIGVGKTELARRLGERLDALMVLEPTDNPFLEAFYRDRRGSAFATQVWFLLARHGQQRDLRQGNLFHQVLVADYLFERDRIFAHLNLDDAELATYEQLFEVLARDVSRPDLVVYLQARVGTLLDRIGRRGRPIERRLSEAYLGEVVRAFDHFFFRYDDAPLLVVDTNEIDPAHHEHHLDDLLRRIRAMKRGGIEYYRPGAGAPPR
jgi:deoxyadenosine/deoxycytidine kinase